MVCIRCKEASDLYSADKQGNYLKKLNWKRSPTPSLTEKSTEQQLYKPFNIPKTTINLKRRIFEHNRKTNNEVNAGRSRSLPPRPETRRSLSETPYSYDIAPRAQSTGPSSRALPKSRLIRAQRSKTTPGYKGLFQSKLLINILSDKTKNQYIRSDVLQYEAVKAKDHMVQKRKRVRSRMQTKSRKNSITEHDYLRFSLRITEDIIKNEVYSDKEMHKVFKSHIEANRGRLDMEQMRKQIIELCRELSISHTNSEDSETSIKAKSIISILELPTASNKGCSVNQVPIQNQCIKTNNLGLLDGSNKGFSIKKLPVELEWSMLSYIKKPEFNRIVGEYAVYYQTNSLHKTKEKNNSCCDMETIYYNNLKQTSVEQYDSIYEIIEPEFSFDDSVQTIPHNEKLSSMTKLPVSTVACKLSSIHPLNQLALDSNSIQCTPKLEYNTALFSCKKNYLEGNESLGPPLHKENKTYDIVEVAENTNVIIKGLNNEEIEYILTPGPIYLPKIVSHYVPKESASDSIIVQKVAPTLCYNVHHVSQNASNRSCKNSNVCTPKKPKTCTSNTETHKSLQCKSSDIRTSDVNIKGYVTPKCDNNNDKTPNQKYEIKSINTQCANLLTSKNYPPCISQFYPTISTQTQSCDWLLESEEPRVGEKPNSPIKETNKIFQSINSSHEIPALNVATDIQCKRDIPNESVSVKSRTVFELEPVYKKSQHDLTKIYQQTFDINEPTEKLPKGTQEQELQKIDLNASSILIYNTNSIASPNPSETLVQITAPSEYLQEGSLTSFNSVIDSLKATGSEILNIKPVSTMEQLPINSNYTIDIVSETLLKRELLEMISEQEERGIKIDTEIEYWAKQSKTTRPESLESNSYSTADFITKCGEKLKPIQSKSNKRPSNDCNQILKSLDTKPEVQQRNSIIENIKKVTKDLEEMRHKEVPVNEFIHSKYNFSVHDVKPIDQTILISTGTDSDSEDEDMPHIEIPDSEHSLKTFSEGAETEFICCGLKKVKKRKRRDDIEVLTDYDKASINYNISTVPRVQLEYEKSTFSRQETEDAHKDLPNSISLTSISSTTSTMAHKDHRISKELISYESYLHKQMQYHGSRK